MMIRILVVLAGTLGVLSAAERKPLPEITPVPLNGGISIQSDAPVALPATGQWVLLYVDPNCGAGCLLLLNSLRSTTPLSGLDRIVVIVGGANSASRQKIRQINPQLSHSTWLQDPDGSIFRLLELNHMPAAIGVRDSNLQWEIGGFSSADEARSRIIGWIGQ